MRIILGDIIINPNQIKMMSRTGDKVIVQLGFNVRAEIIDTKGTFWRKFQEISKPVEGFDQFRTRIGDGPEMAFDIRPTGEDSDS